MTQRIRAIREIRGKSFWRQWEGLRNSLRLRVLAVEKGPTETER